MNYEKKYKEALEKARQLCAHPTSKPFISDLQDLFPELAESEEEKIKGAAIEFVRQNKSFNCILGISKEEVIAWLEKQSSNVDNANKEYWRGYREGKQEILDKYAELEEQGEQKPTQEIEPFEAEHGKYYYCIKDYFCGGKKQASKGDVVQALRGLPIMGLKDASEYFLPVNFIKCNSAWSEEDESILQGIWDEILANKHQAKEYEWKTYDKFLNWLKSLKDRVQPQNKWKESLATADLENALCNIQDRFSDTSYEYRILGEAIEFIRCTEPKPQWKPSEEQMKILKEVCDEYWEPDGLHPLYTLYQDLENLKG